MSLAVPVRGEVADGPLKLIQAVLITIENSKDVLLTPPKLVLS